ncbi:hypothetical protein U1Q18_034110 [Sarracenia purpurea var. burkii]
MRSTLGINFNMCFTKIKLPGTAESSSLNLEEYGRPLPNSTAATATAAASILIKNFNSLYDLTFDDHSTSQSKSFFRSSSSSDPSSSDSDAETVAPDFATVFASQRFFFSSPGRSNSIIDSTSPSSSDSPPVHPAESATLVGGSVAIPTYSQDPYNDFRRSMQEMVEARELVDVGANWDHLHELLTCYLALNPKSTHKFIVRAFSDLLVSLMASPRRNDRRREPEFSDGGSIISRRRV